MADHMPSPWRGLAMGAVAIVLAAVLALLLLLRPESGGEAVEAKSANATAAAAPARTPAPADPSIRTRTEAEQLAAGFRAAFGSDRQARFDAQNQTFIYRPARLEWIGDKAALISLGENVEQSHASSGTLAVHYLEPTADGFQVTGAWPALIFSGTFGAAPQALAVNRALSQYPIVYSEGGGTWQGYTCTWATLVELRPDRPVASDGIAISYSNEGAVDEQTGRTAGGQASRTVEGRISDIERGRAFNVRFTGDETYAERYVYRGNKFVRTPSGRSRPTC